LPLYSLKNFFFLDTETSKVRIRKKPLFCIKTRLKMPELPEVETLCRQLKKVVLNKTIQGIEIIDPKLTMIGEAVGRKITAVTRRGKALEIHLERRKGIPDPLPADNFLFGRSRLSAGELHNEKFIALHLRMTGRLLWQKDRQALPAHARFTIAFSRGRLVCIDPRRFATLVMRDHHPGGVVIDDPLHRCSADQLEELARNRKLPVKSFLMDQRRIAGIGNIYACEMLYEASVNPWRKTCSLSLHEWEGIAAAAKRILKRAVACRGTSISDWRDLFGQKGDYQHELNVYARDRGLCRRCHGMILRERLSGRGTYFCPSCQK
jgi:formamidopyrimidine-DNA glycosylase